MLTFIDVTYIFGSARLGLFSSANILQIASRPSSCLIAVLPMFKLSFRLVLNLGTSEISAIFVFTTKTTQPRPQVFPVNGALTCKESALLTSSVD